MNKIVHTLPQEKNQWYWEEDYVGSSLFLAVLAAVYSLFLKKKVFYKASINHFKIYLLNILTLMKWNILM